MVSPPRLALVTGVTGYLGARLVPRLLDEGWAVRVLTRDAARVSDRSWTGDVDVVEGDATSPGVLQRATAGVEVAYLLIHSMDGSFDFARRDREIATAFAAACEGAGVSRMVYLGGLYPDGEVLSEHLESRREVGRILVDSAVPAAVLQAGLVLGGGSTSFELMRQVADRLPVLVAPRWIDHRVQPIAVDDVLHYLVGAADLPSDVNRELDIGGPDVLTYRELMASYAKVAGLPRPRVLTVPVLLPRTAALGAAVLAPVRTSLAAALLHSLTHEMVCGERDIDALVPAPARGLLPVETAIRMALQYSPGPGEDRPEPSPGTAPSALSASDPDWTGPAEVCDERTVRTTASPEQVWREVERLGGSAGAYPLSSLWRLRGVADRLAGGPGFEMRRDPGPLRDDEVVDFWTVESVDPGHSLRLSPRMRLPGDTVVEIAVEPDGSGSTLRLRSTFRPRGLLGRGYWYGQLPGHIALFQRWAQAIAGRAETSSAVG